MPIVAIENQKLTALVGASEDHFGCSVAISGDYVIIGARGDDENGDNSGAAYIFKKDTNGNFTQTDKLTTLDGSAGDVFGWSVAISGDYAIVGAPGVNNSNGVNIGAAYVFENNHDGTFNQTDKLTAPDTSKKDWFGRSVAISGNYAIVNAPENKSAHIFKSKEDGTGTFEKKCDLLAENDAIGAFGYKVTINGEYAAVTTEGGVGTIPTSAYIYKKKNVSSDIFERIGKLDGSTSGYDAYGCDVTINSQYVVVGAMGDDSAYGSAYLYKNVGNDNFTQVDILTPSDRTNGDRFGCSINMHGNHIIIGAFGHPFDFSTGVTQDKGVAFIFKIDGSGNCNEIAKLTASDGANGDYFGLSVAVCDDYAIAGAKRNDEKGDDTGAAYIYDLPCRDESDTITPPTNLTIPHRERNRKGKQ